MNLEDIQPLEGTQDYLLREWIDPSEFEKVKRTDGKPDVYHDGTYDWYGGFGAFAPEGAILEIGVYKGYSMAAMLRGSKKPREVIGIDCGKELNVTPTREAFYRVANSFGLKDSAFVACDTQHGKPLERICFTPDAEFAIVHIDADHSFDGCLNDLRNFASLVSERGLVILHDTKDVPVKGAFVRFLQDEGEKWEYREIPTVNGNIVLRRKP